MTSELWGGVLLSEDEGASSSTQSTQGLPFEGVLEAECEAGAPESAGYRDPALCRERRGIAAPIFET